MTKIESMTQDIPSLGKAPKRSRGFFNDIGLKLLNKLYGLEYLHYGYFKDLEPKVENLPQAQEAWVDVLVEQIPDDVKVIYDVGCGVGGIAKRLLDSGMKVSCIDPDPYMIHETWKRTNGRITPYLGYYESVEGPAVATADLVLMPESCQYINPQKGFLQTRKFLREGGYFLTSDFFKIRPLDKPYLSKSGHNLESFLEEAKANGFELIKKIDITAETAPTMEIYQKVILEKAYPIVEAVFAVVDRKLPWLYKILSYFFKDKVLKIKTKYENQDAATFVKYKGYFVLLFKAV